MTQIDSMDLVFAHEDDVLMTDSNDIKVLMSMKTDKFIELNHTGRAIWDLIDGSRKLAGIVTLLEDKYDISRQECEAAVTDFTNRLQSEGLVKRVA
ncbi:PqqD family protein [Porphyrobacter sp. AAP60]|uniref:PqqD family protein n=1 Tax=Porphyrobacter sp. AAP60 TaxID=1523423 RepID=UPI0006B9CB59|nr:PqqD family protein [Porphyrobacter sp. AAP60]KPF61826.1 hypothetical protein IP79_14535 [Porphyrobacter sp. AAP60]